MHVEIRKIENKDFVEVSKLHKVENSVEELKWLFQDLNDSKKYNAFVAFDNGKLIGSIGYTISNYYQGRKTVKIVCPMNWIVKTGYKGFAGVLLFKKVMSLSDVNMTIWGTNQAQRLYSMFKLTNVVWSENYYKVLNISDFWILIKKRSWAKRIGYFNYLITSYFKSSSKKFVDSSLELIPYNAKINIKFEQPKFENILIKEFDKKHINWLLACPLVESYGYVIKEKDNGRILGYCVLYIKSINNRKKGKIVHISYLNNDINKWIYIIDKCTRVLKDKGCAYVSVVAINSNFQKGLHLTGYTKVTRYREPIHLRNKTKEANYLEFKDWHFQFSEGEIAIRNF